MKKAIYYSVIAILWMVIHVLLGITMIAIGVIDEPFPSIMHALATAFLIPELWLLSVGITMLSRRVLTKKILGYEKKIPKFVTITLITIGCIMVGGNILLTYILNNVPNEAALAYTPKEIIKEDIDKKEVHSNNKNMSSENEGSFQRVADNKELLLIGTILDFKTELNKELEEMNKEVPIRIDEIMILNRIQISNNAYTFLYQLEIDKDKVATDELNEIIKDFGKEMEKYFYDSILSMCYITDINSSDFFKAANLKFEYVFSDINDKHIRTYRIDCKDFANR